MLRSSLLLIASMLATHGAWAAQPATAPGQAAGAPAAAQTESQQFARARLMEMAKFLAGTEKFSVELRIGYEVVQADGQKIEFGEMRQVSVQRPDRMRVVELESGGDGNQMLLDGKRITVLNGRTGLFAQAPQPGDIDASVVYFVRDLQMRLPLAPLLMKSLPDELSRRVQRIEYVEHTDILGKPAHHIAARGANVDLQVWIADGARPVPLRIVLTYPLAVGQPQFWADFSRWNLSPGFDKAAFTFKPPANGKQIMFSVQFVPAARTQQAAESRKQGGTP
ncbi:MAG: hypothetical protein H6R10_2278 [Rhodocyclaceae bacterium]|nr:hypothetical protein [Rhodocyclaceae bacterium]